MRKYYKYRLDLVTLNIVATLLLIIAIIPCLDSVVNYLMNGTLKIFVILMLAYLLWIILHELLHGIGHLLCGSKFSNLSFGADLVKGILFCLIRKEVSKKQILISLLFPFFFIGILTYIIGIIINSPLLIILSAANISGAAGDLIMFFDFIKLDNDITYIEPSEGTTFYLMSNNLKNKKLFGLKFEEEGEYNSSMFNNSTKKIDITKSSYIIFSLIIIISILILFL